MRRCVFDLEADGLLSAATVVHCGVFKDIDTSEKFKFRPQDTKAMLKFMDSCRILIGQNVIDYDFPLLEKLHGYTFKGTKVDLLLMSRMLYPNISLPPQMKQAYVDLKDEVRSLKRDGEIPQDYSVRISGPHSVEAWGYRLGRGKVAYEDWSTFTEQMLHRCDEDVEIQHLMYQKFLKKRTDMGWPTSAFNLTFNLFDILGKQERHGWMFDTTLANRYIAQLERWVDMIDNVLYKYMPYTHDCLESKKDGEINWVRKPFLKSGDYSAITVRYFPDLEGKSAKTGYVNGPFTRVHFRRLNIGSQQEVKQFLLDSGWEPEEWNYKKDPDTGRALVGPDGQLVRSSPKITYTEKFNGVSGKLGRLIARRITCVARCSILQGLVSNVRPDGRVSQRITGIAATGRLTHGVVVNIPGTKSFFGKQMRKVFTVPQGYSLVGVDASGCQNRAMAARVGDAAFTETLLNGDKKKGTHIHQINQQAIKLVAGVDVTYDESKTMNYAWMFGASDKKLGSTINRSPDVGAKVREAFLSVSPGLAALVDGLTKQWRSTAKVQMGQWGRPEFKSGYIQGLDGRPILIENEHTILVYMLQSDEAILMQYALVTLYGWLIERGWVWGEDFAFVGNVHDEFSAEVKSELAEEYKELAEYSITYASEVLNMSVPQKGEGAIGKTWLDVH